MEEKEAGAVEKATELSSTYEKSFRRIHATFHPAGLPGEIAGKSSNVAFAARHIARVHRAALASGTCDVIITVMDGTKLSLSQISVANPSQPIHISGRTTSPKFAACTILTSKKQDALSTAARSSSTAMLTRFRPWSVVQIYCGVSLVCQQCTPVPTCLFQRLYIRCRCR
jgi:hypothetical protein